MITIEKQIEAVKRQIKTLKKVRDRDALEWCDEPINNLSAALRTLTQLRVIGKGIE